MLASLPRLPAAGVPGGQESGLATRSERGRAGLPGRAGRRVRTGLRPSPAAEVRPSWEVGSARLSFLYKYRRRCWPCCAPSSARCPGQRSCAPRQEAVRGTPPPSPARAPWEPEPCCNPAERKAVSRRAGRKTEGMEQPFFSRVRAAPAGGAREGGC